LASICLKTFVKNREFDFDHLYTITKVLVKNLNKVIDINFYPVDKAEKSNKLHRPIGIGVQGLADAFVLMRFPFDSPEAAKLNIMIFETMYFAALEASMELAIKHGPYSTYPGSPASKGILQFDMWDIVPSDRYDWATLKTLIINHGIMNSLLIAPMPTASTAQIMAANECFEPFTANIYKRKTMSGEFIVVNKYLVEDLININMWNENIRENIIVNEGSVQSIPGIPKELKDLYKTVWEIKQKVIIDMAADRGPYICQSQSMNLFLEEPNFSKLSSMHFYSWQKKLKTGCYYLRSKSKAKTQQFTITPEKGGKLSSASVCDGDVCLACQ
jgi:ribonucleoside-diphosphate reductase alpha subunit